VWPKGDSEKEKYGETKTMMSSHAPKWIKASTNQQSLIIVKAEKRNIDLQTT